MSTSFNLLLDHDSCFVLVTIYFQSSSILVCGLCYYRHGIADNFQLFVVILTDLIGNTCDGCLVVMLVHIRMLGLDYLEQ